MRGRFKITMGAERGHCHQILHPRLISFQPQPQRWINAFRVQEEKRYDPHTPQAREAADQRYRPGETLNP